MARIIIYLFFVSLFCSCGADDNSNFKADVKADSITQPKTKAPPEAISVKNFKQLTNQKGVVGIFDVPETLTLLRGDSAEAQNISAALAKCFNLLQQDMEYLEAQEDGAPGAIYYTNDPKNFVFECMIPIRQIPKKKPRFSKVVVLEPGYMLVYNYYGPYEYLYRSYAEIKTYIHNNNLQQEGPMREFYITDPTEVADSTQWLTRILVPVKL